MIYPEKLFTRLKHWNPSGVIYNLRLKIILFSISRIQHDSRNRTRVLSTNILFILFETSTKRKLCPLKSNMCSGLTRPYFEFIIIIDQIYTNHSWNPWQIAIEYFYVYIRKVVSSFTNKLYILYSNYRIILCKKNLFYKNTKFERKQKTYVLGI